MSGAQTDVETLRKIAIDHHHDVAQVFEQHYRDMAAGRFSTAFTYGRHKVDQVLEQELGKLAQGATVLDVGCGTGAYLKRLTDMGFKASGLEPAEGMLAAAKTANPTLRIEQGVATALPFKDGEFDAVTQIEVVRYLHHEDVMQAMRETFRVLKPGGFAFVTLVNRWALDGFWVLQRVRQLAKLSAANRVNPHCEFTSPREIETELKGLGFSNVRTVGRLWAPMRMAYKLNANVASKLAQSVERVDDLVHGLPFTKPFAGHLIAIAEKPRA